MSAHCVQFEPQYTPELLRSASTAFVRGYLFTTYGRWLVLACVINCMAFALVVWLGLGGASVWSTGSVALLGSVWLAQFYVRYPARFAARATSAEPITRIVLTAQSVEITTRSGCTNLSWSRFKAVVEAPTAFLLVASPFAFLPLPKLGMPAEAVALLKNHKTKNVA